MMAEPPCSNRRREREITSLVIVASLAGPVECRLRSRSLQPERRRMRDKEAGSETAARPLPVGLALERWARRRDYRGTQPYGGDPPNEDRDHPYGGCFRGRQRD